MSLSQNIECENLVIGSGAGGSVAYNLLSQSKKNVLLIEEGQEWNLTDFTQHIGIQIQNLYRNGGVVPINGSPTVGYGEGRALGGSTIVNGGLLWRTPMWVLDHWNKELKLPGFEYKNLEKYFEKVEKNLNVSLEKEIRGFDLDSKLLFETSNKLGWKVEKVPRVTSNCVRSNQCGVGCPSGAKQSVDKNYILNGTLNGGSLLTNIKAEKFIIQNKNITFVKATDLLSKKKINIKVKNVFLAAGALETPSILRRSGLVRKSYFNLNFHINLRIFATFNDIINADKGTMFIYQIQEFAREGILIMGSNFKPSYVASSISHLTNDELDLAFKEYNKSALFTTMVKPISNAKIFVLPNGAKFINHNLGNLDLELIKKALFLSSKLFFMAGASKLVLPLCNSIPLYSLSEAERAIKNCNLKHLSLVSVHSMSSCAIGNQNDSLCDTNGKFHNINNLTLCDASVLPSSTYESPQGSIMAISHKIIEDHLND